MDADVVLLGLGTGGEDLALRLLDAGLDVIGIEPQLLGGECPYWACIPSKMMIRAGNLLQEARHVPDMAGRTMVEPDWTLVAERIRNEATSNWNDSSAVARFQGKGGRFVRGYGRLCGPMTVAVNSEQFRARRGIVVATGSRPLIPPIPGLSDVDYWTTHDVIKTTELPTSLLVLGGGAVACEIGQIWARFGVRVTIVEGQDRLLPHEEPEASHIIREVLTSEGVDIRTGVRAERVDRDGRSVRTTLERGEQVITDRILVAAGRSVDLTGLGLETAGLDSSARFIDVDDRMRAAEGIWAIGDVTGKGMFTHTALYQGRIAAEDILGEQSSPANYRAMPRVTFTDPEVGAVGMTEADAQAAGHEVVVMTKQLPATFRGWIHARANKGVIKLVVDRNSGVLLGATSAGPNGGEVLGLLALAVHARMPLAAIRSMIFPYPTFYGGVGEAIGAYARGITRVLDPDTEPLLDP